MSGKDRVRHGCEINTGIVLEWNREGRTKTSGVGRTLILPGEDFLSPLRTARTLLGYPQLALGAEFFRRFAASESWGFPGVAGTQNPIPYAKNAREMGPAHTFPY